MLSSRATILALACSKVSLGRGCKAVSGACEWRGRFRDRGASERPALREKTLMGQYCLPRMGFSSRSESERAGWGLPTSFLALGGEAWAEMEGVLIMEFFLQYKSLECVAGVAPFPAFLGDEVVTLPVTGLL